MHAWLQTPLVELIKGGFIIFQSFCPCCQPAWCSKQSQSPKSRQYPCVYMRPFKKTARAIPCDEWPGVFLYMIFGIWTCQETDFGGRWRKKNGWVNSWHTNSWSSYFFHLEVGAVFWCFLFTTSGKNNNPNKIYNKKIKGDMCEGGVGGGFFRSVHSLALVQGTAVQWLLYSAKLWLVGRIFNGGPVWFERWPALWSLPYYCFQRCPWAQISHSTKHKSINMYNMCAYKWK